MPPELAGRDALVHASNADIKRLIMGLAANSRVFVGLRGVGKTVLLNRILGMAEEEGALTSLIEANERGDFVRQLAHEMSQVLQEVSFNERARELARGGLEAMVRFAAHFEIDTGFAKIKVQPARKVPIIGDLTADLRRLFLEIGKSVRKAERAWVLLIDEMQHLRARTKRPPCSRRFTGSVRRACR